MNNLSWLIYLAEVSEKVSDVLGVGLTILTIASMFAIPLSWFVYFATKDEEGGLPLKCPIWITSVTAFLFLVFVPINVMVPSKQTIYLIAGSEAGEMVVKSPEAQEIISDVKEILKGQLDSLKIKKN